MVSPVFAIKVTEIETKCDFPVMFECYTILEFTDYSPTDITPYRNNLANLITKKEAFNIEKGVTRGIQNTMNIVEFRWDAKDMNRVTVYGTIEPMTNNYWGIGSIYNSTWWNNTYHSRTQINISRFNFDGVEPIFANLTTHMTNTYGGRIIDDKNNTINYTMLRFDEVGVIDWILLAFPYSNASNLSYNWYFNATIEDDPGYLFAVFVPDDMFYESCDFINDWESQDDGKYTCQAGFLNATSIDGAEFSSDQIQTASTFSYSNLTVWALGLSTAISGNNLDSNRFLAGTRALNAWENGYNLLANGDNPDEFRMVINLGEGGAVDDDSGVDIPINENFSSKVWYNQDVEDAMLWVHNDSDELLYSINTTALNQDIDYWGLFIDNGRADHYIYEFLIFLGYVNPSITKRAIVTQSGVEVNVSLVPVQNLTNGTYVNYSCVSNGGNYSLKNTTIVGSVNSTSLEYTFCKSGCNEANLIISVFGNDENLCNPEIWVQVILFIIFVVVFVFIIKRVS